jgi:hypothetical protein
LSTTPSTSSIWLSADQRLLLKAAMTDGAEALEAYRAWRQGVDLQQNFDRGTQRLLPLLYHNMLRLGVKDPLMGLLKGTYRLAWYDNHVLFKETQPAVAALRANGITALVMKGVPLVLSYYGNHALRPMADIDILVQPHELRQAIAVLEKSGWRSQQIVTDEDIKYFHATHLNNDKGRELDLHWHVLRDACNDASDEFFWSSATTFDFAGIEARQFDATGTLLHVVLHGIRSNPEPATRWIPDALFVIRSGQRLDWDRMIAFAKSQKLTNRLKLALEYLVEHYAAPIPPEVLAKLRASHLSVLERIEKPVILGDRDRWFNNAFTKNYVIFTDYCRVAVTRNPLRFLVGFSNYMRYRWSARGRIEMIAIIARGMFRRALGGGHAGNGRVVIDG